MEFEDYDVEFGYSLSELRRSYSRKAYEVPDYELHSLKEIERCLERSLYKERSDCLEHLKYLEELQKRLSVIVLAEEREGIMNWELREVLVRVKALTAQLSAFAAHLPVSTATATKTAGTTQRGAIAGYSEPIM